MDIKHNIERFKNLTGCSIIEGHLIISGFKDDQALTNLSFPELREVTEYVIFYQAQNIVKLNHLFPNLSVIRGNKLVAVRFIFWWNLVFLVWLCHFGYFLALFNNFWLLLVGKLSKEISDWILDLLSSPDHSETQPSIPKFVRYKRKQTCCGKIIFDEIWYF